MTVSIITPTLNEKENIANTLSVWLNQSYTNLEIVIVDGGSTDGTCDIVKEISRTHNNVRLLVERKTGPAESRNLGCKVANGEIVVFADADIAGVNKDFLENSMKHFEDVNVIGVFPNSEYSNDTSVEAAFFFGIKNAGLNALLSYYPMLMRRDAFLELGGFPNIGYGEDLIMRDKVIKTVITSPKKIVFEPGSIFSIHGPHTLAEFWKQQRWYGRTFPLYAAKAGLDIQGYINFYVNTFLSCSMFFIILIPYFPILIINMIPLFFSFTSYLLGGIKNSNLKISLVKFSLILIGGFGKGFGLLEYLLGKRRIGR
jgi:glycosyltransferase involved in cell wall biosynthesis